MPWFKVDDQLAVHLKAVTAGNTAMGLWVRAGSWCGAQLTDGFVPESMVSALGGARTDADALASAGLWHPVDGGWTFHDWAEYQPTREQVVAEREAAAERMRRVRANKQANTGRTNGVRSATPSPSPVPSPKTTYVNESQSLDNRAREATDSLSVVQQQMAARAGLDVERIRGKVFDQLGIHLTLVNALALGNHICSKTKKWPNTPTPYVLTSITRNPAEIEKHIYDSGLA